MLAAQDTPTIAPRGEGERSVLGLMQMVAQQSEQRIVDRPQLTFDGRPELWYNRVEAFHGGVELDATFYERLQLRVGGGFSSGQEGSDRWTYQLRARLLADENQPWMITAGHRARIHEQYQSRLYGPFLNSLSYTFGGDDYFDYFRAEQWHGEVAYTGLPWDGRLGVEAIYEDASSLDAVTGYDILSTRDDLRTNPSVSEGSLVSFRGVLRLGEEDFRPRGLFGQREAQLSVEHGFFDRPGDGASYTRFSADIHGRIPTFEREALRSQSLDFRITGATYAGTLPPQRDGLVDGTLGFYSPFGSLRTQRGLPYVGAEHVAVHYEHNFRTAPFRAMGFD